MSGKMSVSIPCVPQRAAQLNSVSNEKAAARSHQPLRTEREKAIYKS